MDWLATKIDNALTWIGQLIANLVGSLFNLITDAALSVLEMLLNAIASILGGITPPAFLTGGLQNVLSGIDSSVLYFLSLSGFTAALAILGTGFAFRMLRKLFTLGQW